MSVQPRGMYGEELEGKGRGGTGRLTIHVGGSIILKLVLKVHFQDKKCSFLVYYTCTRLCITRDLVLHTHCAVL